MKNILLLFLLGFTVYASGQNFRYSNKIFNKIDTLKGVQYAVAPWLNNPVSQLSMYNVHEGEMITEERPLLMDIFKPASDTLTKKPAIVFIHGGAFILGSRYNDDMVALCDSFARRGYVTSTIDYRLGMSAEITRIFGIPVALKIPAESALRAVYRATQDGRAAIRFLKQNAEMYGIDTTNVFMVGSSAGGLLSLNSLYLNQDEIAAAVLENPDSGGLDAIGVAGFGGKADAVVSYWGAIENTSIIERETNPVFLVHGEADDIVPFRKGVPLEGIVPPNPALSYEMPEAYGSFCIDTALNNRGIFHETYFVANK